MRQRSASPIEIIHIAVITAAIIILVFVLRPYIEVPSVHPHLQSAPYAWPKGCKLKSHFAVEDEIPAACMVDRYYFEDAEKYNFPQTTGIQNWGRNYYRVDDKAINFNCFSDGKCVASNVVRNVFIAPEGSPQHQN